MTTITGNILDAADNPLHVLVTFTPKSAPFFSGSDVIAKNVVQLKSDRNDGSFSVQLEAGVYSVTYSATPQFSFDITVPGSGSYTIDQLASLPAPSTTYTPAGNGSPEGIVSAIPGMTYVDALNGGFYVKITGTGNTGWQQFVQL